MALEEIKAQIALLMEEMVNQPQDKHEVLEQVREKLNELRAMGMPLARRSRCSSSATWKSASTTTPTSRRRRSRDDPSSPPRSGGEVSRRSRDGEGALQAACGPASTPSPKLPLRVERQPEPHRAEHVALDDGGLRHQRQDRPARQRHGGRAAGQEHGRDRLRRDAASRSVAATVAVTRSTGQASVASSAARLMAPRTPRPADRHRTRPPGLPRSARSWPPPP